MALAGVAAQLVDGSLGMAFGITSTTVLLTAGVTPAIASASVHLAEIGTSLTSGLSHWRFGNVDWAKVGWLAIPGGVGAFVGAGVLTAIPATVAEPVVAVILFGLGVYILARFAFDRSGPAVRARSVPRTLLSPLGLMAGFMDALGGGGWGPLGSSTLLASRRMEPRKVVGTMAAGEFLVTLCASAGFLLGLSASQIPFRVVGALLVGGAVAAPVAAWIVRLLDARVLGTLVGGIIVLTNARTLLVALGLERWVGLPLYGVLALGWLAALVSSATAVRAERRGKERATEPAA